MPFNQGSCNEFSSPVKMLLGSIVWACVKCTFESLVPLLRSAGSFLKVSQSCLVKRDSKDCQYLCFVDPVVVHTSQAYRQKISSCLGRVSNESVELYELSERSASFGYQEIHPQSLRVSPVPCFAQSNRLSFILIGGTWYLLKCDFSVPNAKL